MFARRHCGAWISLCVLVCMSHGMVRPLGAGDLSEKIYRSGEGILQQSQEVSLTALLPRGVDGWKATGEDRAYGRENLHEYIDGGAELYLSFDLVRVAGRAYVREGQPDIIADIFEMESSRDAFGVFSLQRERSDSTFGQGSQYTGGLLLFWKNKYFVSLLASPETKESREAVEKLAGEIDAAIPGRGSLPGVLGFLPRKSLVPESIRYFHHYAWLNSYYFVAAENILRMDEKTEAVLAKYREGEESAFFLIVRYPDIAAARAARDSFTTHYLRDLPSAKVVRIEDGTWTGCLLEESMLTLVLGASSEVSALRLIERGKGALRE